MKETKEKNRRIIIDVTILAFVVIAVRMLIERALPFFYESLGYYFSDFMFQTLSKYPVTLVMVLADFIIVRYLLNKIKYGTHLMKRAMVEIIGVIVVSIVSSVILKAWQYIDLGSSSYFFNNFFFLTLLSNTVFNIIVIAVIDVFLYYRYSNKMAIASEVEKRARANYQYQLLKTEINPHFLFNCLNVLDYLIYIDQDKASMYLKKMANVYRYLLKVEKHNFVILEEEIDFLEQYIDLLRERFGDGIDFKINIPQEYREKKIIPCTLQMMVENAVKHNIVNKNKILYVFIHIVGNNIIVKNNIQYKPKTVSADRRNEKLEEINEGTSEVGLSNLQQQYNILFKERIKINIVNFEGRKYFEVRIPLID